MPQYSDETLKELGQILLRARNNPKTSTTAAKMVRELDPSIKFPDLEVQDLREEFNAKFEEQEIEREREAALRQLAAQRRRVSERFNNDPKHIHAIEETMKKYGIADYEAGAKLYAADSPPPVSRPDRPTPNWTMPNIKELMERPLQYEREEAYKAIDDINAQRQH